MEKEDAEFKALPETLTPCINNCGHASTTNSNCFTNVPSLSSESGLIHITARPVESTTESRMLTMPRRQGEVNRCAGCKRKVGLTGFRCRCGNMFCAEHRYSDRHECSFNYKAAGKIAIARENPVVKASKIVRI